MKFCMNCGAKMADNAKFCVECGHKVENIPAQAPEVQPAAQQPSPRQQAYVPPQEPAAPERTAYRQPPAPEQPAYAMPPEPHVPENRAYAPPQTPQVRENYAEPPVTDYGPGNGGQTPFRQPGPQEPWNPGQNPGYAGGNQIPPVQPPQQPRGSGNPGRPPRRPARKPKAKTGMIVGIVCGAVAAVALIVGLVLFFVLGGKSNDPNLGVYEAKSAEAAGETVSVSQAWKNGFAVELKKGGKCIIRADNVEVPGEWTLENENIHISGGGIDCSGTLRGGVMELKDVMGVDLKLLSVEAPQKPTVPDQPDSPTKETLPDNSQPSQTTQPDATQDPAETTAPAVQNPTLAEKLAGTYILSVDDTESKQIEIREIGGMLMLETGCFMGESIYSYWAVEFWPDNPSDLTSTDANSVSGTVNAFSNMAMGGDYQETTHACTLTLDGEKLVVDDAFNGLETMERFGKHIDIRSERDFQKSIVDNFTVGDRPEDWIGTRAYSAETWAILLELREDGSATYVSKLAGTPMVVVDGGWLRNQYDNLVIVGEQIGWGKMPRDMENGCSVSGDSLMLTISTDNMLHPSNGEFELTPVEDSWRFPDDLVPFDNSENIYDVLTSMLTYEYDDEGTYTTSGEYPSEISYNYQSVYLAVDTEGAKAINSQINSKVNSCIRDQLDFAANKEMVWYGDIGFIPFVHDDLLSLVFYRTYYASAGQDNLVFVYDMDDGKYLTAADLLAREGLSETDFLEACREAAKQTFIEGNSGIPEEDREAYGYSEALAALDGDSLVNMELIMPFVNDAGDLGVIMPVPSLAGANYYEQYVYPDFS